MLQSKIFWKTRVMCRKPLITNELGMVLLVALLKSMIYWKQPHEGTYSKSHLPTLAFLTCSLFDSDWTRVSPLCQIRIWTTAVNNIQNSCKFVPFLTFVGNKMKQVDNYNHMALLFAHSHACTHSNANTVLVDDCSENHCVVKVALQMHFPKTIWCV